MRKTLFVVFFLFVFSVLRAENPSVLYLTWTHDPTTTMMIHWHTEGKSDPEGLFYREKGKEEWIYQSGVSLVIPKTKTEVHTLELVSLKAGTDYEFYFEQRKEIYLFQTLPENLDESLTFAVGGDVYGSAWRFRSMGKQVAQQNPRFAVLGGDLAYTHGFKYLFRGRKWQVSRWQSFLQEWNEIMRTPDGHLIPMIPVIGNHDVRPSNLNPFSDNLLFYEIFFLPGNRSYRTLDVGSFLSFFLLDTGHSFHMEGAQTTWLAEKLVEREHKPYKLGVYHVGAYPSVYSFQSGAAASIRTLWSPLFEKYGVQMTFEHHNHAYKRTYPLNQGQHVAQGVIYMGDGSWGVAPRKPKNKGLPYFAKTKKANTVSIVTLSKEKGVVRVISSSGKLIDTAEITPSSDLVSCDERRVTRH